MATPNAPHAPVARNDVLTVDEAPQFTIDVADLLSNDTDMDSSNLQIRALRGANDVIAQLQDRAIEIQTKGFVGATQLIYTVSDGVLEDQAVLNLNIVDTNEAPLGGADGFKVEQGQTLGVVTPEGILRNDTDGDLGTLTAVLDTDVTDGRLTLNRDGSFTYNPNAGFFGTDSFTYFTSDGDTQSAQATTVNIAVVAASANDAPVSTNDSYTGTEDQTATISSADVLSNDAANGTAPIQIDRVLGAKGGTVSLEDANIFFFPDANFNGIASFVYVTSDESLTDRGVVEIDFSAVNDAPVANDENSRTNDQYQAYTGGALFVAAAEGVLANDTDVDGDALTANLVDGPANGALTLNADGSFEYTADTGYVGTDTFTYFASDGQANSTTVTVNLSVTDQGASGRDGQNTDPRARSDSYDAAIGQTLTVSAANGLLSNDADTEGDTLTAALSSRARNGDVVLNDDGSFSYTAFEGTSGSDTFSYYAYDGFGRSEETEVRINGGSNGPATDVLGQTGTVTVSQTSSTKWQRVDFDKSITDATVVMGGLSFNGKDAANIRVRKVSDTGFEFQLDEWDYLDGTHTDETVSWMALSEGRHTSEDGRTIVAGKTLVGTEAKNVSVDAAFGDGPVVLSQVTSISGKAPVSSRVADVDGAGFSVLLEEEEGSDGFHVTEQVSYIVVETGTGDGYISGVQGGVNQNNQTIDLASANLTADTAFLAGIQTRNGPDTATVRVSDLSDSQARVFVQEEKSLDNEVAHSEEEIGFFAIANGVIKGNANAAAEATSGAYETGDVAIAQTSATYWQSVTFDASIQDAVVVMGPATSAGKDPMAVNIRNVTDTGFEFQIDEWDYLDGAHAQESLSYMAISAGDHTLEDGRHISAGMTSANDSPTTVNFASTFDQAPIVLAQAAASQNVSAVATRISDVTTACFATRLQEEEANDGAASGDVMWIAVEGGTDSDGDIQAGTISGVDERSTAFNLDAGMADEFAFLADMQTFNGLNPATVRLNMINNDGGMLFVEKERSSDTEVVHDAEEVGYLALEIGYFDLIA